MGWTYAVLGLGRQGIATVYDLVTQCDADRVLAFDPSEPQRRSADQRFHELLGANHPVVTDEAGHPDWSALTGQADVVLSCAPYRFNPEITRACLDAGLPMCDLGGNPKVVEQQRRLCLGKSVPVVPECGVAPGIANVVVVHMIQEQSADQIQVRCGGLPLTIRDAGSNPLRYKLTFDPHGLISEYSGRCPAIEDGEIVWYDACTDPEPFDDQHECFPTSNNALPIVEYFQSRGVRSYNYKTIRYNGHWACIQGWKALGFLQGDPELDEQLAGLLARNDALRYDRRRDRDKIILTVRGLRTEDGGKQPPLEYRLDVAADQRTLLSAMEMTTSWGITIVAHHIASGRGAPDGFATPERFVDTGWFLDALDRRLDSVC